MPLPGVNGGDGSAHIERWGQMLGPFDSNPFSG